MKGIDFEGATLTANFTLNSDLVFTAVNGNKEVIRINGEGKIFWNKREVETDDELRAAMLDLKDVFVRK